MRRAQQSFYTCFTVAAECARRRPILVHRLLSAECARRMPILVHHWLTFIFNRVSKFKPKFSNFDTHVLPKSVRSPQRHLDEAADGLAVGGHDVLLVRVHDHVALRPAEVVL